MGKKIFALLQKLKPKFIEGGEANNHPKEVLNKIWKDWEAFASYAFNKSHSTCYAWIGYQTAYLKAHYPAEYMAAVLSNNMSDIKQVNQWYAMNKSNSLEEWLEAMKMRSIISFNGVYADREDNIYFLHNSSSPLRKEGINWKILWRE